MAGPCTGLTVLDFSLGMPGALCTLVMADYGAEVIKVEPPGGDPFRCQPAGFHGTAGRKALCWISALQKAASKPSNSLARLMCW